MTTHRNTSDADFDTHLSGLSATSIDNKITSFTDVKTELDAEQSTLNNQRNQLRKHTQKVSDMLDDLNALKSFNITTDPLPQQNTCYVNQAYVMSDADGSIEKPYTTLEHAIDYKISAGQTDDVVFIIAAGLYTC